MWCAAVKMHKSMFQLINTALFSVRLRQPVLVKNDQPTSGPSRRILTPCEISGFCCQATENCVLLCYYAVIGGDFLPMFRDNLLVPSSGFKNPKWIFGLFNPEDGTNRLSQNISKELLLPTV
jgi:hypothetical protein